QPPAERSAASRCWALISMVRKPCLLRRKPQGRKVGSHNRISGEPACVDRFAVIRLRQRTARNLPLVVYHCSERWAKMCEHQVLRSHALCHGAEIGGQALAIIGSWRKSAAQ